MSAPPNKGKNTAEEMRKKLESELIKAGLGKEQINLYNLEELKEHLVTINHLISNPESLGSMTVETSFSILGISAAVKETLLPIILERKKLILDRINFLKGQEKITNLRELIDAKVNDPETRKKLNDEISQLEEEAQQLREQTSEIDRALATERAKRESELTKLEIFKGRSQVWLNFLERESVATIVGGFLIIIITIALIFGMFTNVLPPEVLTNAFLLILGYFFGQAVTRGADKERS